MSKKFARLVKEVDGKKQYICANCAIEALIKLCTKLQEQVMVQEKREKQQKEGRDKLILPKGV